METKQKITIIKDKLTDIGNNLKDRIKNIFFSIKTGLSPKFIRRKTKSHLINTYLQYS